MSEKKTTIQINTSTLEDLYGIKIELFGPMPRKSTVNDVIVSLIKEHKERG
ncbi:MAG: hypothetical protein ACYTEU_10500 [Planctomycetota bacterium]|jgi:hypothetical protein